MHRLTFSENGKFGVVGMNAKNQDDKLYMCVAKLKDYENTDKSPDQVLSLKERDTVLAPKPDKRIPGIGRCQICKTELCIDDENLYFCPTCGQRLKDCGSR